jgi:hypothetical protein
MSCPGQRYPAQKTLRNSSENLQEFFKLLAMVGAIFES